MSDLDFKSSKLGTKEYWDNFYKLEHKNFTENPDDTGECWFDESNAEDKMCDFIFSQLDTDSPPTNLKICDLGTGNGHLLFQLLEDGLKNCELFGIDYSQTSIEFAKNIASKNNYNVKFETSDLLNLKNDQFIVNHHQYFDLILDKGTLDAIALNDQIYESGLNGFQIYPLNIIKLMKHDSILLITSCNFTEDELCNHLTKNGDLKVWKKVQYPVFEFGGNKGSTICTVAFKRI